MVLKLHTVPGAGSAPLEHKPATAAAYVVGQALVWDATNGWLVTVSAGVGEDTDEGEHYVSMFTGAIATNGDLMPVVRATEDLRWTIPNQTTQTNVPGNSYTLHTDGLSMTNTTTKGCFKVEYTEGTAAGDLNVGRLV